MFSVEMASSDAAGPGKIQHLEIFLENPDRNSNNEKAPIHKSSTDDDVAFSDDKDGSVAKKDDKVLNGIISKKRGERVCIVCLMAIGLKKPDGTPLVDFNVEPHKSTKHEKKKQTPLKNHHISKAIRRSESHGFALLETKCKLSKSN